MAGILAGILSDRKTGGTDASNNFNVSFDDLQKINGNLRDVLNYQGSAAATDPLESSRIATNEVMNNPMLAQLFGKGGALERAGTEEQNLASRGYSLKPEDYEAYGQASGNIARMFDQGEAGLAQALANRGLSNSGVANQAFMTSQGNKMEQLAQMQRNIANDRMQMNMQRLGQTRQFMSQLGQQGANAIQQQFGRQQGAEDMRFNQALQKNNAGEARLRDQTEQANTNLAQRQATQELPGWAAGLSNLSNMGSMIGTSWATMGANKGKSGEDSSGTQADKQARK